MQAEMCVDNKAFKKTEYIDNTVPRGSNNVTNLKETQFLHGK